MRERITLLVAVISALLGVKEAFEGAIIPIYNEGIETAAAGGDITPYIVAMAGLLVAIALPVSLLRAVTDA